MSAAATPIRAPVRGAPRRRLELSNPVRFGGVFVVVNLHTLRNVDELTYLTVYALTALWTLNALVKRRPQFTSGPALWWVALATLGAAVTASISGFGTALLGLTRFLFAIPVLLALVAFTENRDELVRHVRTMTLVFTVGALTLPLQFITGPISFFASDSERAGLVRYSSLLGSLTTLGIALGCYVVLSYDLPRLLRPLAVVLQLSAGAASLSKAAVANGLLGLSLIVMSERRRPVTALLSISGLAIAFAVVVAVSPELAARVNAVATSFGLDTGVRNYDRDIEASAMERLTTLPIANITALTQLHSPLVYVIGGGFGMGSTALVSREASLAPMAHNQYVEFFTVFGAVGGAVAVAALGTVFFRLLQMEARQRDPLVNRIYLAFGLWLLNAVFANGIAYQPVTASILWLAVFCVGKESAFFLGDLRREPPTTRPATQAGGRAGHRTRENRFYARLHPDSRR